MLLLLLLLQVLLLLLLLLQVLLLLLLWLKGGITAKWIEKGSRSLDIFSELPGNIVVV
jgi:hypothetical protein